MKKISRAWDDFKVGVVFRHSPYCVLSYPKSGRTWVRIFLGKYFAEKAGYSGDNINIEFASLRHRVVGAPRIIFSHGDYRSTLEIAQRKTVSRLKGKRTIFLVRDPRDVVVSLYFQLTKREADTDGFHLPKNISMSELIRHDQVGIGAIIDFMNRWYEERGFHKDFLVMRYEEMRHDPEVYFRAVLKFLGEKKIDEDAFTRAREYSSFSHMKELEKKDALNSKRLKTKDKGDEESFKVRKGKVGGYMEYLNEDDLRYVEEQMKKLDPVFGYSVGDTV